MATGTRDLLSLSDSPALEMRILTCPECKQKTPIFIYVRTKRSFIDCPECRCAAFWDGFSETGFWLKSLRTIEPEEFAIEEEENE